MKRYKPKNGRDYFTVQITNKRLAYGIFTDQCFLKRTKQ